MSYRKFYELFKALHSPVCSFTPLTIGQTLTSPFPDAHEIHSWCHQLAPMHIPYVINFSEYVTFFPTRFKLPEAGTLSLASYVLPSAAGK